MLSPSFLSSRTVRIAIGAAVLFVFVYALRELSMRRARSSPELVSLRTELALKQHDLEQQVSLLAVTRAALDEANKKYEDLKRAQQAAELAVAATPANAEPHPHGMHTVDPNKRMLHPNVLRNEANRWSLMDLPRDRVRLFAQVQDAHFCKDPVIQPQTTDTDFLCTLDVPRQLKRIPLNVTLLPEQFAVFQYVPTCPAQFAREACDLANSFPRLQKLIVERSAQTPLLPPPATSEPRDPQRVQLAYFIASYRADATMAHSIEKLERLLRRIHHPKDVILLHADLAAGVMFAEVTAAMVLAENFTSVKEFLPARCVSAGGGAQAMEMELAGFKRLLSLGTDWEHAIYLTHLDFPLRTRNEIIAALRPGMSYFMLKELSAAERETAFFQYWQSWITDCPNPTRNMRFRLATRDQLPGLTYARSDNVYVLSRELVTWLASDEFARLLWLYFRTTAHPQEHYIATAVATDRRFVTRVERQNAVLFEMESGIRAITHTARFLVNGTRDRTFITAAHRSGRVFFVHKPKTTLMPFIDHLRDPAYVSVEVSGELRHEH